MYNLFLFQDNDGYIYNLFLSAISADKKNIRMFGIFSDISGNTQKDIPILHKYYSRQYLNNKLLIMSGDLFNTIKENHKTSYIITINNNNPNFIDTKHEKHIIKSSIDKNTEEIINAARLLFNE